MVLVISLLMMIDIFLLAKTFVVDPDLPDVQKCLKIIAIRIHNILSTTGQHVSFKL